MHLALDIETIPTDREDILEALAADIKPPANYKKQETIDKWVEETKPGLLMEAAHKTALDGTYGQIFCLCARLDPETQPAQTWYWHITEAAAKDSGNPEKYVLESFMQWVDKTVTKVKRKPLIVGHNVSFDLRFIWQRCMVHGVRPTMDLAHNATPWSGKYYDTMHEWAGTRGYIKLKDLCRALGIDDDSDIDGKDVYDAYLNERYDDIVDHCVRDVQRVSEIYTRLTGV